MKSFFIHIDRIRNKSSQKLIHIKRSFAMEEITFNFSITYPIKRCISNELIKEFK